MKTIQVTKIYKHHKDLLIHRSNKTHLGGTMFSSRQTLHLFLLCGNQHLRWQDRHSCPVHPTRRSHPNMRQGRCCLAQLRYGPHWHCSGKEQCLILKESLPQVPPSPLSCEGRNDAGGTNDGVQDAILTKCIWFMLPNKIIRELHSSSNT